MTDRLKFERGEQVVYRCTNPATGYVLRVARDGSWADVRWDSGMDHQYTRRVKTANISKTNPIFNRLAADPVARVWVPEYS
jgi:hypothetical protein